MGGDAVAYVSSNDRQIRALIAAARQNFQQGRPREAERLIRQAEMAGQHHPLVLNETAGRLLRAGQPLRALPLLERANEAEPGIPDILMNLAQALARLDRVDEAVDALEKLLVIEPGNVTALLDKGDLEEQQCRARAAAMSYRTALQSIPPGFPAAPLLAERLERARRKVEENNRALESFILDGLSDVRERFADEKLSRFDQCVDTLLQKRRVFRQQPTFMFFPELPAVEFYDRALFPWLDAIDAAAADIRAEFLEVMSEGEAVLDPYVAYPGGMPMEQWRELNMSRRWGVYSLWREGKAYPEHIARCPKTVAALDGVPRWDVPGSGPTALFSILDAKTRIPPHTGPVNTRLVCHLPLVVPPGCRFRVGGQEREWHPGEAFVFDDSINHEAWNDSDMPRAVLIFDVWSPYITEAERELVRALTVRVGEWYGTTSNSHGI